MFPSPAAPPYFSPTVRAASRALHPQQHPAPPSWCCAQPGTVLGCVPAGVVCLCPWVIASLCLLEVCSVHSL